MFVRVETAAGSYLIGGIAEKIADRLSQLIASYVRSEFWPLPFVPRTELFLLAGVRRAFD